MLRIFFGLVILRVWVSCEAYNLGDLSQYSTMITVYMLWQRIWWVINCKTCGKKKTGGVLFGFCFQCSFLNVLWDHGKRACTEPELKGRAWNWTSKYSSLCSHVRVPVEHRHLGMQHLSWVACSGIRRGQRRLAERRAAGIPAPGTERAERGETSWHASAGVRVVGFSCDCPVAFRNLGWTCFYPVAAWRGQEIKPKLGRRIQDCLVRAPWKQRLSAVRWEMGPPSTSRAQAHLHDVGLSGGGRGAKHPCLCLHKELHSLIMKPGRGFFF